MDIQRGDRVYYRGEVWTVEETWLDDLTGPWVEIVPVEDPEYSSTIILDPRLVQRVEQIR